MELKYYAIISCFMGEDFIEIDADSFDEVMGIATEWIEKKVEECDMWESAYVVKCPSEINDDGESEPNAAEYVEWYNMWERDDCDPGDDC